MGTATRVISTIVKIILILAIIAGIVLSIFFSSSKEPIANDRWIRPNAKPSFANTIESSKIDGKSDLDKAIYLYELANRNYISCDKSAYFVQATNDMKMTIGITIPIQAYLYIYSLRTLDEYYKTEYSVPNGSVGSLFAKEDTDYAIRAYQDLTMDYCYAQKAYTPAVDETGEYNSLNVDWGDKNIVPAKKWKVEQEKEIFSKKQNETYYQTKLTINKNTIKDVKVELKEEKDGNYYEIVITLNPDVEETYARNIENLRKGAGDDAYYKSMVETIQIWDNGYYKSFRSLDSWVGKGGNLTSDMDYFYTFYYEDEAGTVDSYKYFTDAKTVAKTYTASK